VQAGEVLESTRGMEIARQFVPERLVLQEAVLPREPDRILV
jgi:hypothetical protein